MKRIAILLISSLATATAAAAPVRYVSDELLIMMRSGQGMQYQIVEQLRSGSRLKVLEEGDKYVHVRSPKGREGWVLAQYLSNEPIARQKLAAAEKKVQNYREESRKLNEKMGELGNENGQLKARVDQLTRAKADVEKELEHLRKISARPAQLNAENRQMKGRIAELEAEVKRLGQTNSALQDRSQRDWFLSGAGVLGGGIFLGLVLPLLRRRKSSGFDLR